MRLLYSLKFLSRLFEPTRVFFALLIAVMLWLSPALTQPPSSETNRQALQEYGGITLISAVDAKAPSCSNACKINVCTKWIALGQPGCLTKTNPWDIGCCTNWEVQCDPDCVDPTPTEPPTISASLNCSQSNNGWCAGSLALNLSAADPQAASVIISGTVNGTAFACPSGATACSIPISSEGAGTISYRVDSATGLSASNSTSYNLDLTSPQINASLNGTPGANSFYISFVTVSAAATDSASGIQSLQYSLDNRNTWNTYSGALSFTDGAYSIIFRATDYAGWSAETSAQNFSVDTVTPLITINTISTLGNNPSTGFASGAGLAHIARAIYSNGFRCGFRYCIAYL